MDRHGLRPRDDGNVPLRVKLSNPLARLELDRHGLQPRDDGNASLRVKRSNPLAWLEMDRHSLRPRDDGNVSLRVKRSNPLARREMDRHSLQPRDDGNASLRAERSNPVFSGLSRKRLYARSFSMSRKRFGAGLSGMRTEVHGPCFEGISQLNRLPSQVARRYRAGVR